MTRTFRILCLALVASAALLAGCSSVPTGNYGPCAASPGSYACQIDRYQNAA